SRLASTPNVTEDSSLGRPITALFTLSATKTRSESVPPRKIARCGQGTLWTVLMVTVPLDGAANHHQTDGHSRKSKGQGSPGSLSAPRFEPVRTIEFVDNAI